MNENLAKSLYSRSILKEGSEILIPTKTEGVGKRVQVPKPHMVKQVKENSVGTLYFACQGKEDKVIRIVPAHDIQMIEGMDPERFGKVYNIKPDGSYKSPGKKRGRKPKNRVDTV